MAVGSNISPPQADRTYETQVEIRLNGILMGYLHLMVSPDFLAGKEALMEKFLAFPLSLWFNKRHIENMTATRLRNDFIRNLATGNYTSYQEMVQQGAQLNFDLNKPYTCIMMKAVLKGSGTDIPEYSNQIAQDAQEIERIMLQEGKRRRLNTMVTNLEPGIYYISGKRPPFHQPRRPGLCRSNRKANSPAISFVSVPVGHQ